MRGSLSVAVGRGMTWLGISEVVSSGLRIIATIILARLLLAEDFGVVAMATVVIEVVLVAIDLGFGEAIIQRKDVTESHLSTIFWTGLALGVTFCAVTVAISPIVAGLYGEKTVGPILAVYSLIFALAPLRTIHGCLLRKRLEFSRFAVGEIGHSATYLILSVSLATLGLGGWSLVLGSLASQVVLIVLRWTLCRWQPSRTFSLTCLKELWGFSASVTGNRLIHATAGKLDQLIIGRFLSATSLGFYYLAMKIPYALNTPLAMVVEKAIFPTFSLVQDEHERMRRGFIRGMSYLSLMVLPMFVGLAILAPQLVPVVFGEKWSQVILPMQILCVPACVSSINALAGPTLLAKGRPDIILKISLLQLALMVASPLIGIRFGVVGVAAGVSIITVIVWLIYQITSIRLVGLRLVDLLNALRPAAFGSAVMAVFLLAFGYIATRTFDLSSIWLLAISVALGIAVYFVFLKALRTKALDEIIELIRDNVGKMWKFDQGQNASFGEKRNGQVTAAERNEAGYGCKEE